MLNSHIYPHEIILPVRKWQTQVLPLIQTCVHRASESQPRSPFPPEDNSIIDSISPFAILTRSPSPQTQSQVEEELFSGWDNLAGSPASASITVSRGREVYRLNHRSKRRSLAVALADSVSSGL